MAIWLYHINPKNRYGYTMGWDISRPSSLLRSADRTWTASNMFNKVQPSDMICVYMKNIPKNPDGIYIVGTVQKIGLEDGASFSWSVDRARSARTSIVPIQKETIRKFFPRSYGGSMQKLSPKRERAWLSLLGRDNKIINDTPVVTVRKAPGQRRPSFGNADPMASRENGRKGERHVLALLRNEYPSSEGYEVEHVAAKDPFADHDISISKAKKLVKLVEVKTRAGKPPDPVIISDRELQRRKQLPGKHDIYVVYLDKAGSVHSTLRIGRSEAFYIFPRQYWLHPGPV